jgi:hypothetical protein
MPTGKFPSHVIEARRASLIRSLDKQQLEINRTAMALDEVLEHLDEHSFISAPAIAVLERLRASYPNTPFWLGYKSRKKAEMREEPI